MTHVAVILLRLVSFMLEPAQQAGTFDRGYFYPGPVVAGVTLDTASAGSRQVIAEFGRPHYDRWIADVPAEVPLTPGRAVPENGRRQYGKSG